MLLGAMGPGWGHSEEKAWHRRKRNPQGRARDTHGRLRSDETHRKKGDSGVPTGRCGKCLREESVGHWVKCCWDVEHDENRERTGGHTCSWWGWREGSQRRGEADRHTGMKRDSTSIQHTRLQWAWDPDKSGYSCQHVKHQEENNRKKGYKKRRKWQIRGWGSDYRQFSLRVLL